MGKTVIQRREEVKEIEQKNTHTQNINKNNREEKEVKLLYKEKLHTNTHTQQTMCNE